MNATGTSFNFINGQQDQFVVPYFQRAYVWTEENWERMLESLTSTCSSHFLGSIIVKNEMKKNPQGFYSYSVIDGQQRITTLSILMRALMDNLNTPVVESALKTMLFCKRSAMFDYDQVLSDGSKNGVVKLVHGFHDYEPYTLLIENPAGAVAKYPDSQIIQCYQYFLKETSKRIVAENLFTLLVDQQIKFMVKIELDTNDNEQAIFDVTNGTGVSLTCADIIKNDLFLHISDYTIRLQKYKSTWEEVFDGDDYDFWASTYNGKTNIENLLFSVAEITTHNSKSIYDPLSDTYEQLSAKYREFFNSISTNQSDLLDFLDVLTKYAKIYRNYFTITDGYQYCYHDYIPRYMLSFANLNACTVLFPYLLKLFVKYCDTNGEILAQNEEIIKDELQNVERLLIRAAIIQPLDFSYDPQAKPSTKNFNKAISKVISSMNPDELYTAAQLSAINDDNKVREGLHKISNNTAKVILFLLNLDLVNAIGKSVATTSFCYNYELEHILPQQFDVTWGLPDKDIGGKPIPVSDQEEYRRSFVYQLGNMTLITPKANKQIKNYDINTKMYGVMTKTTATGKVRKGYYGYQDCANEPISQSFKLAIVSAGMKWDEAMIDQRTEKLTKDVLRIWA